MKEISTLTPLLATHDVKNIAVGLEDFGLDDFVKGEYFNGELYIDVSQKTYKDIGYKRYSTSIGALMAVFSKRGRDRMAKNRKEKIPSDTKGDGLQNGGTLVITKGGEQVLLDFRQDNPAAQVELSEILRALQIPTPHQEADSN